MKSIKASPEAAGMEKTMRLFFAVNLPPSVKHYIAESILPLVPNEGWKKVSEENLHVTLQFLGHLPKEAIKELWKQVEPLREFEPFEAELNCAGHFKGNVLWLGFGKGNEEFKQLNGKLQQAIGTHDPKFHAHITIARNKGTEKRLCEANFPRLFPMREKRLCEANFPRLFPMREKGFAQAIAEKIGKEIKAMKIAVKSVELMESGLGGQNPKYGRLFSIQFAQGSGQSF